VLDPSQWGFRARKQELLDNFVADRLAVMLEKKVEKGQ